MRRDNTQSEHTQAVVSGSTVMAANIMLGYLHCVTHVRSVLLEEHEAAASDEGHGSLSGLQVLGTLPFVVSSTWISLVPYAAPETRAGLLIKTTAADIASSSVASRTLTVPVAWLLRAMMSDGVASINKLVVSYYRNNKCPK